MNTLPHIPLTELEEQLASPEGPALRADLLERLADLELRLRRRLAGLLPRVEFEQLAAAAEAARVAQDALRVFPVGVSPSSHVRPNLR